MSKNWICIVLLLFVPFSGYCKDGGSFYISKLDKNTSWAGNSTGANRDSVFTIKIKNIGSKLVSKTKDAHFTNIPLGKRYLISISMDGKQMESFWFSFENYSCDRLWLYYTELYGTWSLRTSKYSCKR